MQRLFFVSLTLIGMMASAPCDHADLLAPGQGSTTGDSFTESGSLLIGRNSGTLTGNGIDASYQEWVYRESNLQLNFIFQVTAKSDSASLTQVALGNFTGLTTDVGTTASVAGGSAIFGGTAPAGTSTGGVSYSASGGGNVVSRSADGSTVDFNFTGSGGPIAAGHNSVLLTVQTNALTINAGNLMVADSSGTASVVIYEPTPTPEPSTMVLVGLGALGFIAHGRRRRKVRTA